MRIGLTGHTAGIGKYFYDNTPDVMGFSRANGYDISRAEDRKRIVEQIEPCDIFINNAYCRGHQTDLLYEVFAAWRDKNRIIVNLGSVTTDGIKNFVHPYAAYKASLDKASEQLNNLNAACKIILVRFGWVGTQGIISKFNPDKYIALPDAYKLILDSIEWTKKYNLSSITLKP